MCGLTGCWELQGNNQAELHTRVKHMTDTLAHRGPDDAGFFVHAEAGLALGFRRLAIIDLSAAGHQPMQSASGRYVITFNGEIYNFIELRQQLEKLGHHFRGGSDTEVILAAMEQWGIAPTVTRLAGMFGFAVWDRQERTLTLARDRLGIKPMYYGWMGSTFLWGSELKALRAHPDFALVINRDALQLFTQYKYVPAPYSIYQDIVQLPPATTLTVHHAQRDAQPVAYWSVSEAAANGIANPFQGSPQEAVAALEHTLREIVRGHMISDAPIGAFLSGGVDSSTVVALMQAQSATPVRTFCIGFHEQGYNEAEYARAVAQQLGTDHTELYVSSNDLLDVIPRLPQIYDEPFGDASQIPTFLVSQLTRQHVTVSLSGDGGDELFAGYKRYFSAPAMWRMLRVVPVGVRERMRRGVLAVPPEHYDRWLGWLAPYTGRFGSSGRVGDKLHKFTELMGAQSQDVLYQLLMSDWRTTGAAVVRGSHAPALDHTDGLRRAQLRDPLDRMMYIDMLTYLPNDILTKTDRASMAASLEGRVPLLDHRLVEFAWRLPLSLKVRDQQSKWILRQVLYKYVPRQLIERPKAGFTAPIGTWLRGDLREWAEDLLDERRLRDEGYFHPAPIRKKWHEHRAGIHDWQEPLWNVLMFQAWLSHWGTASPLRAAPALASVV